jgi:kynurenine formamidase
METKRMIECSHLISESTVAWPGGVGFSRCPVSKITPDGYFGENYNLEGRIGTHIDSPGHFIENGRLIDELSLEELRSPGVVIDVREKCEKNPDYELTVADIQEFEMQFGVIPDGALVCMRTGWGAKASDSESYMNFNRNEPHPCYSGGTMHFPGFSKESALFLIKERTIHGVGIDTLSLDSGISSTFDVHLIMLGNDKYHVENMFLEDLPPTGFTFLALPLKVKGAPEMMARVVAFL